MRQCKNGGRGMCEGAEGPSTLRLHHDYQEEQGKLGQFSNLIPSLRGQSSQQWTKPVGDANCGGLLGVYVVLC